MPDEEFPCVGGIDARKLCTAPRDERHSVEGHPLPGDRRALLLLPMRFAVAAFHEIARERLRPGRVDCGPDAREEAAGLDELGGHHRIRLLLRQCRPRKDDESHLTGTDVVLLLHVFDADLAEQAREK